MKGRLIIIEAGDGCGKATQTKLLAERLKSEGKLVKQVSFPDYQSESSALIKMYLQGAFGKDPAAVNAYAASVFYAVDRYASFRLKWQEAYESGAIILADRYTTSNMVHQAVKIQDHQEREAYLAWLWDFEFVKMGLPVPDAVIFLDLAPCYSAKLIEERAKQLNCQKDIHEQDQTYLTKCYEAYTALAKKYDWKVIACAENDKVKSIKSIHDDICRSIQDIL